MKEMGTRKFIKAEGINFLRLETDTETVHFQFDDRQIVEDEHEARRILNAAIKEAIEVDPESLKKKYGLIVSVIDSYKSIQYSMVARVMTDDEELENFMSKEFPILIELLRNNVEIRFKVGRIK